MGSPQGTICCESSVKGAVCVFVCVDYLRHLTVMHLSMLSPRVGGANVGHLIVLVIPTLRNLT